jgi:DnaJ-class molecular chaperone
MIIITKSVKMEESDNHYLTLGLDPHCSQSEINEQYKKLVIKWHPDKNSNKKMAEDKFKQISKAYQILSDPDARKYYDMHGINVSQNTKNIIDPSQAFKNLFDNEDNDIPNVIVYLDSDINDLYTGFKKQIDYSRYSPCKKCDSTGTKKKVDGSCNNCKGRGILMGKIKGGELGYLFNETNCEPCDGSGLDPGIKKCKKCNGNKYISENMNIEVIVPRGAYDQYCIRIENKGNYIPIEDRKTKNTRSDLMIVIKEHIPDTLPIRRGMFIQELKRINKADLLMDVKIEYGESIAGLKKNIDFLAGKKISFEIDQIVQNGDIYVVQNMGMPFLENDNNDKNNTNDKNDTNDKKDENGDLFLVFRINDPVLNNRQRKKMWQIITGTSYPDYPDINDPNKIIRFDQYLTQHKKNTNTNSDANTDSDPDTDSDTDSDSDANSDSQSKSKSKSKPKFKSDPDSDNDSDSDSTDDTEISDTYNKKSGINDQSSTNISSDDESLEEKRKNRKIIDYR